jgi:hypothetical protein
MGFKFDPNITGLISGQFTSLLVSEPGGLGASNLVIDPSQTFDISVEWTLSQPLSNLWLAALSPADWSLTAYAESVGPGPEIMLKQDNVTIASGVQNPPNTFTWNHTFTVGPNVLDEENPGNPTGPSGVYKLVVTAFLNSTLGTPGYDIMGFEEGPIIKVENPV